VDDRKLPHPLDYKKKPPFPWLIIAVYSGLIAWLAAIAVMIFNHPGGGGVCFFLSLIGLFGGVSIWLGIKRGSQKKDFWF